MSVAALRTAPRRDAVLPRLFLALAATALVAGAAWLLAALLAPTAAPPPARNPFGMGLREAAPAASGVGAVLLSWQSAFFAQLRDSISALKADGTALPGLMAVGFAYGVFHAAGPGHGKAVIAGYILSGERALRRGLALSLAAALIQALVAIALVSAVFLALGGTAATMAATTRGVELAGFALVAGLGALLVWRKAGRLLGLLRPQTTPGPAGSGCDDHGHLHGPGDPDASWRDLAAVALGAGIRPCAGALVLLTFARGQGLYAAGIAAVFAMALGTALATGALATLAVFAKRLALRLAGGRDRAGLVAAAGLELAAAALVLVVGASLLAGLSAGAA